jgi:hypothetical protein
MFKLKDIKDYPANTGRLWSFEEETALLDELKQNMDIETIAEIHKRTVKGINARRKEIVRKLHDQHVEIHEIAGRLKFSEEETLELIIQKKQTCDKQPYDKQSDLAEIKADIKILQKSIKELADMLKAIYEFENEIV